MVTAEADLPRTAFFLDENASACGAYGDFSISAQHECQRQIELFYAIGQVSCRGIPVHEGFHENAAGVLDQAQSFLHIRLSIHLLGIHFIPCLPLYRMIVARVWGSFTNISSNKSAIIPSRQSRGKRPVFTAGIGRCSFFSRIIFLLRRARFRSKDQKARLLTEFAWELTTRNRAKWRLY